MIKVFHIITHFDLGGAERVAINISKSNSPEFEYHIFEVCKGNSDFTIQMIDEFNDNQIIYYRSWIKNKKLAILLFPFRLLIQCFSKRPNIIHTHTEIPDVSIFLFHKLARIFNIKLKYIRTIHNTQLWNSWKKTGKFVELFFKKNDSNVAISESTQKSYISSYDCNSYNIPIIYNGLSETNQKKFPDIRKGKINILFAGRIENQKGIKELILVIKALKDDHRFHFFIIGDGILEHELKASLKFIENVTFYNKIYNLPQYLSSFDYLFMPSNFEGLPLLSIEASFNKTPVIINNCPGLNETLPNNWPLTANNNSIDDFLNIFRHKLHKINRDELITMGYDYVKCKFSIKQMQEHYEQLYKRKTKQ